MSNLNRPPKKAASRPLFLVLTAWSTVIWGYCEFNFFHSRVHNRFGDLANIVMFGTFAFLIGMSTMDTQPLTMQVYTEVGILELAPLLRITIAPHL